jgi:flagellar hook assembly protein FlgD
VEESGGTVRLGPAYPNPFRSGTTVPFFAPGVEGRASVEIYDVGGRVVRRLEAPDGATSGELHWDGRDELGRAVPSSVYFLRMTSGTSTASCSLVKTE